MSGQAIDETPAPLVATVVLNWRRRDTTRRCLDALARVDYGPHVVIVVDNGGADFSAAEIETILPGALYLRSDTNLGFAGGANLGMHRALACGADYVWFLNNDALPEPHALRELIAVARASPPSDIVGAKILLRDDPRRLDSIALRVDLRLGRISLIGHGEVDRGQYDDLGEPAAVTACAMLVGRSACEKLGGFDESYFAYLEDADLCLRARAAGFRVAIAPRATVLHDRPIARQGRQSVSSLYYTTRNHLALLGHHDQGSPVGRRLRLGAAALLATAYATRRGPGSLSDRLRAVRRGVADYRAGRRGGTWEGD